MSGAEYTAEVVKRYGVDTVFWVPAVLKSGLVEMERVGIRRVLCHSEKAAAYMADGYARASRGPGIVMAQSVGAANLAAGLQDAYLGMSSVIAITGRRPAIELWRHAYQEIDHRPLFESVTKCSLMVDSSENLPLLLRHAFREATSGSPGPVHLDFLGYQGESVDEGEGDLQLAVDEPFGSVPPFRSQPKESLLLKAAELLRRAQRPVLVAGGGVRASQANKQVLTLAERLSMPVATSLNAKGVIPESHPLSVGVVGTYGRACANQIVTEADLVLFVGSRTGSQTTHFWTVPPQGCKVIQIDVNPTELGRNYPNLVSLLGDARVTLACLIEVLGSVESKHDWLERTAQVVTSWRHRELTVRFSDTCPIRPERLCQEIVDAAPENAVLVADTGHAAIWSATMMELNGTEQQYLRSAGSLGWAFPAALGVKCAAPERPVICFTGDGGFWYHLSELETARRCGINTVTVVNNNNALAQSRLGAERAYGEQGGGNRAEMWAFGEVDFAATARQMGCLGIRVERPEQLHDALEQALRADKPAVVDVLTDGYAMPPSPIDY